MKKPLSPLSSLAVAGLLSLVGLVTPSIANAQIQFNAPPISAPGNREAGSSRYDSCADTLNHPALMAVLPTTNVGLTTQPFPTFIAYVPPNTSDHTEFRLYNEQTGELVYLGTVALPEAPEDSAYEHDQAILALSLPDDGSVPAMEVGTSYLWALMVVCDDQSRADDIVVTGVTRRVASDDLVWASDDIRSQLNSITTVPPDQRPQIYGGAGLWQDMLASLADLVMAEPDSFGSIWSELLTQQGLAAIAPVPVVESHLSSLTPNQESP